MRWVLAAIVLSLAGPVSAGGRCDLGELIGYQLVFGKPIEAYVENGARRKGYAGCQPDRVLVFADRTGVRCKIVVLQKIDDERPTGYLFAKTMDDMKLCVEGELFAVTSTN